MGRFPFQEVTFVNQDLSLGEGVFKIGFTVRNPPELRIRRLKLSIGQGGVAKLGLAVG